MLESFDEFAKLVFSWLFIFLVYLSFILVLSKINIIVGLNLLLTQQDIVLNSVFCVKSSL